MTRRAGRALACGNTATCDNTATGPRRDRDRDHDRDHDHDHDLDPDVTVTLLIIQFRRISLHDSSAATAIIPELQQDESPRPDWAKESLSTYQL